jgi:hypothetical protein
LRTRFHPPASCPPPPEYYGLLPARRLSVTSASHGVLSLIAASTSGVHHRPGSQTRTLFRPRRFSRPRRFTPPPIFAGLFHPAATSRVCPTGVCPSPRSRTGFHRPSHALVPLDAPACGVTRSSLRALDFRAFSPRGECGVSGAG